MQFDDLKTVWMDGELMPWGRANVHVSAQLLHYGSGVYEGIRCYATPRGPAVLRLEEHIDRLFAAARAQGLDVPYTPHELGAAVCQTIAANQLDDCHVRPIVFDPRTSPVAVAVMAWPSGSTDGRRDLRPADAAELHFVDDCTFAGAYSALPCI